VCSRSRETRVVEHDGTRVTEAGEWGRFQSAPFAPSFPLHLRRLARDVTVIHSPNPTAELAWLMARPRGKLVVRYQSDVVRQAAAMKVYRPFLMALLRRADMVLPTSSQYLDSSPVLRELRPKCRIVPLGILSEEFQRPDPARVAALREQYGPFVFFSGRHRYYKGLRYLVEAAPEIRAKVVIAGDGPERAACLAREGELGVDIAFPGALEQGALVDYLHACSVFAFPSVERSEAFGISMLEAQACGKPVVATRLGTGVELVNRHNLTGYNVPPKDPGALAEALNALLADDERREAMGEAAQRRVAGEFSAEVVARKEFRIYEEVMAS